MFAVFIVVCVSITGVGVVVVVVDDVVVGRVVVCR